ncbi:AraC family transcriptional regulator [Elizabethkingia sp. YR214]|uniref:AraC family transcriptional regulator n=1 Tax=Elizabethkingia sp. YR214 TaxID=2135667 RepID=UPI000D2FA0CA|nr:AraC family transcriptional regulator [Elizabethkingia sp. YR214]PUB30780.1 AraC family transcriptional regulator [Elizabethkingia sp. YR214]
MERIQHIIKYIENNYNQNIPIQKIEQLSNYSYRNIQRVFKNIFKESLGAFQKRLKLENAYKMLLYTHAPITEIAYTVGFESLQSFSKSFKKQFDMSPLQARAAKQELFNGFISNYPKEYPNIAREIVYLNQIEVFFIAVQTKNYDRSNIDLAWDKINAIFSDDASIACYGIIVDEPLITNKTRCRYEACVTKDPLDKDFISMHILGGKYAKYIHKGSYDNIEDTYRCIYHDWLFNSDLEFDSSPIVEYYVKEEFNTVKEEHYITEILVPIKKK